MATYRVDYTASEPVWGDVTLKADSPDEAEADGKIEVARTFPEYTDIVVEQVQEVIE